MKKIIIIAFVVLTTGLVSSCTKDSSVKPAKIAKTIAADKTDVGQGDSDKTDVGQGDSDKTDVGQGDK